ncbi:putative ATP-dependent RNA helicase TDRD12 [Clavelina lepadiformis]|uniref:putative ATP-dependent RNA helicase TDRD12 n=1 Tax=Clavelina lepadiformis TaxID=159417 RepID=UPI0040415018
MDFDCFTRLHSLSLRNDDNADDARIQIVIKKVQNPYDFWGVQVDKPETSAFHKLKTEIESYFGDEQFFKTILPNPAEGKKCIAYWSSGWHRARVEKVLVTHRGCRVRCFLVDKIMSILVPSTRVFVSPPWVWEIPSVGIKFSLHGVHPVGLCTDYNQDKVQFRSCSKWHSSAVQYFIQQIQKTNGVACATKIRINESGIHFVHLFLELENEFRCINDMLIEKNFAAVVEEESLTASEKENYVANNVGVSSNEKEICRDRMVEIFKQGLADLKLDTVTNPNEEDLSSDHFDTSSVSLSCQGDEKSSNSAHDFSHNMSDSCPQRTKQLKNNGSGAGRGRKKLEIIHSVGDHSSCGNSPQRTCRETESLANPSAVEDRNEFNNVTPSLEKNVKMQTSKTDSSDLDVSSISETIDRVTSAQELPDQDKSDISCFLKTLSETLAEPEGKAGQEYPGKISSVQRRILLLEKFLIEAKEEQAGFKNHLQSGVGRGLLLSNKRSNVKRQSFPDDAESHLPTAKGKCKYNNKNVQKSSPSHNKKQTFFTSKTSLVNNYRSTGTILVQGVNPPNPFGLFCDVPFPSNFIALMEESLKYRGPYFIQSHAWAAILEGRNLVALAPSGGGKTLAYVAPLASSLHKKDNMFVDKTSLNQFEASFFTSKSPIVIVLCSTWKNVHMVEQRFRLFLGCISCKDNRKPLHKVVGIIGGPNAEESQAINLIAGSSVLICSPHTLLRILKLKYIDLSRLEKLVLDEMHVLIEDFTSQIRDIMGLWSETLNDVDRPTIPNYKLQILGFGIQWTAGIESFMKKFMNKPLLYISDPLEAAVYGEVQHEVKVFPRSVQLNDLVAFLRDQEKKSREGGIAIFVSSVRVMRALAHGLQTMSFYCQEAYNCMPDSELQEIQKAFEENPSSAPILVVCDDVLSVLEIETVEFAVHFELPKNSHQFGLRLFTMKAFFNINKDRDETILSKSITYLTGHDVAELLEMVKLSSRVLQKVPMWLQELAQAAVETKEVCNLKKSLCPYFQAYGKCRDVRTCNYRHFISEKLDAPNLDPAFAKVPEYGHVRVIITSVYNATYFYGRLLKYRPDTAAPAITCPNLFDEICKRLLEYYSVDANCLSIESGLKPGDLLAVKISGLFYRAKAVSPPPASTDSASSQKDVCWKTPAGVTKLRVHLVDTGAYHIVNIKTIYKLPESFRTDPFQAIIIRACNIKPVDLDTEWLFGATELVHHKINGKEIEGNVVLALGHTIWLKPVVIRSKLPKSGLYVTDCNVVNELLNSSLAEKNPQHLTNIIMECKGRGILPDESTTERENVNAEMPSLQQGEINADCLHSPPAASKETNAADLEDVSDSSTDDSDIPPLVLSPPHKSSSAVWNNSETPSLSDSSTICTSNDTCQTDVECQSLDKVLHFRENDFKEGSDLQLAGIKKAVVKCSPQMFSQRTNPSKIVLSSTPVILTKPEYSEKKEPVCSKRMPSSLSTPPLQTQAPLKNLIPNPSPNHTPNTSLNSIGTIKPADVEQKHGQRQTDDARASAADLLRNRFDEEHDRPHLGVSLPLDERKSSACIKNNHPDRPNSSHSLALTRPMLALESDSNGLLYPQCKQLLRCNDHRVRIRICEDIYVTCSECYASIAERDLRGLSDALMTSRQDREAVLLTGAALALAKLYVPVFEYLSMSDLVQKCCLNHQEVSFTLPETALTLCTVLLNEFMKNQSEAILTVCKHLVSYLNQILNKGLDQAKMQPVIVKTLNLLNSIFALHHMSLVEARSENVISTLLRLEPSTETEILRKDLFLKLVAYGNHEEESDGETADLPPLKEVKNAKLPRRKKVFDALDYDRFNNIDTDTETGSVYRPFSPVYVKFDSETETCETETDGDIDCFPGI